MGRKVLITGASTGIGAATAIRFAESGATIGIHYFHSADEAQRVASAVEAKGATPILLQGDLTRPEACEKVVQAFAWQTNGMDVLVNNAGGLVRRSPVEELEWGLIDDIFRLNVYSAMYMTKLSLPHLKKGESPVIINLGSIASRHGAPTATAYGASKAALQAFTRGLAKEVAPRIRANAVAPGVIDTPFHQKVSTPEQLTAWAEGAPLKRNGTAEDIAEAIYYLCSPAASFITGETLDVNGGLFMR